MKAFVTREIQVIRAALFAHVLNWMLVISPAAGFVYWLNWALWVLVPVMTAIAILSASRGRHWTVMRGLILVMCVLNGASLCLVNQWPVSWESVRSGFAFLATSAVLPLMMVAEMSILDRKLELVKQSLSSSGAPDEQPAAH